MGGAAALGSLDSGTFAQLRGIGDSCRALSIGGDVGGGPGAVDVDMMMVWARSRHILGYPEDVLNIYNQVCQSNNPNRYACSIRKCDRWPF